MIEEFQIFKRKTKDTKKMRQLSLYQLVDVPVHHSQSKTGKEHFLDNEWFVNIQSNSHLCVYKEYLGVVMAIFWA